MQKYVGKICIIRGDRSGVFFGEVVSVDGHNVILKNARCLYYWAKAATILQLSIEGDKEPENCKFTMPVDEMGILDAIEIIPCAEEAIKNIDSVKVWKK